MQLKGRLSSYCTNIGELLCCTCTIAMHLFLGRSVYKHVCTVLSPSRFLWREKNKKYCLCCRHYQCTSPPPEGFNNQHFSIVSMGVGGEFSGGGRMGITIVLSHSHCTIESYLPPPHPPSVCLHWPYALSGLTLRRSHRPSVAAVKAEEGVSGPPTTPPLRPDQRAIASGQLVCHRRD